MIAPFAKRLPDALLEEMRRNFADAIAELQKLSSSSMRVLKDVTLASGVATPVPHGLGRAPQFVAPSCIRGASTVGMVEEVRDGSVDRTQYVNLRATGYGATITVDLQVL